MIWLLYYLSIYLLNAGIRISALWNDKSKQWVRGRKGWFEKIKTLPAKSNQRIWFHVSSLGEFEQARPVMENLKRKNEDLEIILTFFSPSGYMPKSDYPLAHVFYLPMDLPGHAKRWIEQIQPDFAVFVKYDLWAGYLKALEKKKIPAILISAHWQPEGYFHSSSIPPTRALLKNFKQIFLQKGDHLSHFENKGFANLQVAGDTRIDRSLELPEEVSHRIPEILKSIGKVDVVAGSTWPPDEKILLAAAEELDLQMIIAPHDVSKQNISRLLNSSNLAAIELSKIEHTQPDKRIIIVDSIGLLNVLYALGRIAYVGGGFGAGIHNTLEAAAHRKPILFGPHYGKFPEAIDLIEQKAARSVTTKNELTTELQQLLASNAFEDVGEIAFNYLVRHRGASKKITDYILESLADNKLTNDN
jgi:3-deoxy-D-manno-octulosonic-acid transferase